MTSVRPATAALVVLLGLVPVGAYALFRNAPEVALSLVSVVLIAASLYYAMGGSQTETGTASR